MERVNRPYLEATLVGLPLPTTVGEAVTYALAQPGGRGVAMLLDRLPPRSYTSVNDIGEELWPVAPEQPAERPPRPEPESGDVPGGPAYTRPPRERAGVAA